MKSQEIYIFQLVISMILKKSLQLEIYYIIGVYNLRFADIIRVIDTDRERKNKGAKEKFIYYR